MKYNVGDEVLLNAVVVKVNNEGEYPIRVHFKDGSHGLFDEKCMMPDMSNVETIPQEEVMKSAYEQGLNDAWELLKKIYNMRCEECGKIFDGHEYLDDVFDNFTPQEALAKLKEYEETQKKVEIGDIVEWLGVKAVVLDKIDEERIYLFDENGCVEEVQIYNCMKLGKQLDIKSLIEQIGE